jgi:hypothetical protein
VDKKEYTFDMIQVLGGKKNPRDTWAQIVETHPEVLPKCENLQFPGAVSQVAGSLMADLFLGRKSINHPSVWDPTQFKIQPDGSFRISIRGMAAMAGVNQASLGRSLKSADAENALPCAKSLVAQGFYPDAVSSWGETGGIPENAAPFILEHYGISATTPSTLARTVLLSFSRVGINAYSKERRRLRFLGLLPGAA